MSCAINNILRFLASEMDCYLIHGSCTRACTSVGLLLSNLMCYYVLIVSMMILPAHENCAFSLRRLVQITACMI